jgi:predicted MFS family arabinose efflux permease
MRPDPLRPFSKENSMTVISSAEARPVARFQLLSRETSFWAIASMLFLLICASAAPTPLYRVYEAKWHFSALTETAIFAVYALALLTTLLTAGRLSDYFGRRPVIITGLAVNVAACVVWWLSPGIGALFAARALQGISLGLATGAIGAALLELQRAGSSAAALLTSAGQMLGLAVGALAAAGLVQYAPYPTDLVWWLLLGAFVAGIFAVAIMPEPGPRRAGWLPSLRPQVRVPHAVGATFAAALPCLIAVWALSGFYLSLGPALVAQLLHSANLVWGGLAVFLLVGIGSFTAVAVVRVAPRTCMVAGCLLLLAGTGLTLGAVAESASALFLLGTAVAGAGFGPAWTGTYRLLVSDVAPGDRAGLVAAIFIVAYLSFSLPVVIAGLASQHFGIHTTALVYSGAIAVLVAAAAAVTGLRRQPGQSAAAETKSDAEGGGRSE